MIHPKVKAAGIAGALVIVANALLYTFTGYSPSPEVAAGEAWAASFAAGYLKDAGGSGTP